MTESEEAVESFRKNYTSAQKKHPSLPDLEQLDGEWDVLEGVSRHRHFPLNVVRFTRWYMIQAINGWASYLHEFILPNQQNAVSMEEYNYLTEEEKKGVVEVLNWIMYRNRSANVLQLDENDEKSAELIGKIWAEWGEKHKPTLREIIRKNTDVWKQKVEQGPQVPKRQEFS